MQTDFDALTYKECDYLITLLNAELAQCTSKMSRYPLETMRFKLQKHQDGQLIPFDFKLNPSLFAD